MNSPSLLALRLHTASLTRFSQSIWKRCDSWTFRQERCRFLAAHTEATSNSSSSASTAAVPLTIPDPTWSVASLQLNEAHLPATMEELQVLAQRAALDVRSLDNTTRNQLCQDLGNMLHMIQHVQDNNVSSSNSAAIPPLDPMELYDVPRGVNAAPFRDDDYLGGNADDRQQLEEQEMVHSVRASFLEPKMRRVGGHQYYEINAASSIVKGSSKG